MLLIPALAHKCPRALGHSAPELLRHSGGDVDKADLDARCYVSWGTRGFTTFQCACPFRVELWDRSQQHIRWVIAASSSIALARAAFEAAVEAHPHENLTLRNGALVIREHAPQPDF
jgi:hypothetical protein